MMQTYFVKRQLFGIDAGRVERFSDQAAGRLLLEGVIEPYDQKNNRHANALREQERKSEERRAAAQRILDAEQKAQKH